MQNLLKKILLGMTVMTIFNTGCSGPKAIDEIADGIKNDTEIDFFDLADEAEISVVYAEEAHNAALAQFLADYYGIDEESCRNTRYYYNYYDLNQDGQDEVIATVLSEELTDGSGNPVLILSGQEGEFSVLESFDWAHTPIYLRQSMTNGWCDLILNIYGKGLENGYRLYRHSAGGGYQDGESILYDDLPRDLPIVQILSNNLIDDYDRGDYLTIIPDTES